MPPPVPPTIPAVGPVEKPWRVTEAERDAVYRAALSDGTAATPVSERREITTDLVEKVKEEFGSLPSVTIVQAPGEADPQLALLALTGHIDAVITEDSDLVLYGVELV